MTRADIQLSDSQSVASSSFGTEINDLAENEEQESVHLAQKENKKVKSLKAVVLGALAVSALAVALAVYYYIKNGEEDDFEKSFGDDANKVLSSLGSNLDLTMEAIDGFVVNIMSFAKATNQTWPFVTIPDFGVRAGKVLSLTGGFIMNLYPLVENGEREAFEHYMATHNEWVEDTIDIHDKDVTWSGPVVRDGDNWDVIYGYDEFDKDEDVAGVNGTDRQGPYLPWWQCYPVVNIDPVYGWDLMSQGMYKPMLDGFIANRRPILSDAYMIAFENDTVKQEENADEAEWIKSYLDPDEEPVEPVSDIYYPLLDESLEALDVFKDANYTPPTTNETFHGLFATSMYWRDLLKNILPDASSGIVIVFDNPCSPSFTYQIDGPEAVYLGDNDQHDSNYDHMLVSADLLGLREFAIKDSAYSGLPLNDQRCPFHLRVYPSDSKKDAFMTTDSILFACLSVVIFVFTSGVFILYDFWVERRQKVVMNTAVTSTAIVSSLFPSNVRDRMYTEKKEACKTTDKRHRFLASSSGDSVDEKDTAEGSMPIADSFPETTVFFADIAGFTSWSSSRSPSEVFILLETLYGAFDKLASARKVFKVETIGDCYMAVAGLPNPQPQHAMIMVRFAADCRSKMNVLTRELELQLGPGTADLKLRIGLHSGPVTAGVLRGQKARFQLFGDTVNTASRMESNGVPDRIQISQKTADYLFSINKGNWLTKRPDLVMAKGKGEMQTWWAEPKKSTGSATSSDDHLSLGSIESMQGIDDNLEQDDRLIDWSTTLLLDLLKKVVSKRQVDGAASSSLSSSPSSVWENWSNSSKNGMIRDEVTNRISGLVVTSTAAVPPSEQASGAVATDHDDDEAELLSPSVVLQMQGFVTAVASSYGKHLPFHNFERASHTAMQVKKMLFLLESENPVLREPLVQFTLVLSALLHDVNHPGCPNADLIRRGSALASRYENQSIAEQNSLDIGWGILVGNPAYADLRACICSTESELNVFRQVLVHSIVATDVLDEELQQQRQSQWQALFGSNDDGNDDTAEDRASTTMSSAGENGSLRRHEEEAAVILGLIMQVSDWSHTMKQWFDYQRWNEKLYQESVLAFESGGVTNPKDVWFDQELFFLDKVVVPLAEKVEACHLFASPCSELVENAKFNRDEWKKKGSDVLYFV